MMLTPGVATACFSTGMWHPRREHRAAGPARDARRGEPRPRAGALSDGTLGAQCRRDRLQTVVTAFAAAELDPDGAAGQVQFVVQRDQLGAPWSCPALPSW